MKSLQAYISERNTQYDFRIKVAKQDPNEIMEEIKNALDAYELISISKAKSLPIQEHREFPKWGACECWQFEATVAYPTTAPQIAQLLKERTGMQAEWVCVYNKLTADQNDYAEALGKDHTGSLLLDDELKEAIEKELPENIPHIFISSATQSNLTELKDMLWKALND